MKAGPNKSLKAEVELPTWSNPQGIEKGSVMTVRVWKSRTFGRQTLVQNTYMVIAPPPENAAT